jgi:hypothetical protein
MRPDEGADESFGDITEFKPWSEGIAEEKT